MHISNVLSFVICTQHFAQNTKSFYTMPIKQNNLNVIKSLLISTTKKETQHSHISYSLLPPNVTVFSAHPWYFGVLWKSKNAHKA